MVLKQIKKTGFLFLTLFACFCLNAQNPTYNQLISIVSSKIHGADVSDKMIAFVCWSSANQQSRELNKEFDRVSAIYEGAKMKNATKGTYLISCSSDDPATATIVSNKDGIHFAIRVNASEFNFLSTISPNSNVVYDAKGVKVFENLNKENIFLSFNGQLTR